MNYPGNVELPPWYGRWLLFITLLFPVFLRADVSIQYKCSERTSLVFNLMQVKETLRETILTILYMNMLWKKDLNLEGRFQTWLELTSILRFTFVGICKLAWLFSQ